MFRRSSVLLFAAVSSLATSASALPLGSQFRVNDQTPGTHITRSVAASPSGDFAVTLVGTCDGCERFAHDVTRGLLVYAPIRAVSTRARKCRPFRSNRRTRR
jgi:hypothetical protein